MPVIKRFNSNTMATSLRVLGCNAVTSMGRLCRSHELLRSLTRRCVASASPSATRSLHSLCRLHAEWATVEPRGVSPFAARGGAVRSMFIQTESTPNPQSVKFRPGRVLLDERFTTGVVRN